MLRLGRNFRLQSFAPDVSPRLAKQKIENGQHEKGQRSVADDTADDDGGERALNFRANASVNRHWNESDGSDKRGH